MRVCFNLDLANLGAELFIYKKYFFPFYLLNSVFKFCSVSEDGSTVRATTNARMQ